MKHDCMTITLLSFLECKVYNTPTSEFLVEIGTSLIIRKFKPIIPGLGSGQFDPAIWFFYSCFRAGDIPLKSYFPKVG